MIILTERLYFRSPRKRGERQRISARSIMTLLDDFFDIALNVF
jgi:hypothetical protein